MKKSSGSKRASKRRTGRPPRDPKQPKAFVPPKPYADFPLTPHASGAWMKKINGKVHYFGRWATRKNGKLERLTDDGWQAALALYKAQKDDLYAGRDPQPVDQPSEMTVGALCNLFITQKVKDCAQMKIGPRMLEDYRNTTDLLVEQLGKNRAVKQLRPRDFTTLSNTISERWGSVRQGNVITRAKSVFKWAYESDLIDAPVKYGPDFKKPSATELRKHKAQRGPKMLTAEEVRRFIKATSTAPLRAMVLLGVNCGFGPADCAALPLAAVDLKRGWINFPRPKTGVERRCPLWPETVQAMREALQARPTPSDKQAEALFFITPRGLAWMLDYRETASPISKALRQVMIQCGVHRPGFGPYTLRHVFATVASGCRDQVAVNYIMGHADSHISATYREMIEDERLAAVTQHVRQWLKPKLLRLK